MRSSTLFSVVARVAQRSSIDIPAVVRFRSFSTATEPLVLQKKDNDNGKDTGVVILSLNRPKSFNALTVEFGEQFRKTVLDLSLDESVRCVVLTGEGKAFSAGGDLEFLADRHKDSVQHNSEIMRHFYQRFLDVRQIPVPVISAINGPAVGAGMCLALGTDIRIASKTAKMGLTFVQLGIHPGMGATHFLPKLVGNQVAARLLLTGDLIEGEEAEKLGVVLQAVEQDKVVPTALTLARKIAAQSTVAIRSCVRSLRMHQDQNLDAALWREADSQAHCYASTDVLEGVAAVREKRPADFYTKRK